MNPLATSRRSHLMVMFALAAATLSLLAGCQSRDPVAQPAGADAMPLIAYVGTFSSPLKDVLPTQVDLPPGNGRGIHLFRVDRATGELTPAGVQEMGTSPSCLAANAAGTVLYSANETDHVGDVKEGTEGTISAFAIDRAGTLRLLNTVPSDGPIPPPVVRPARALRLLNTVPSGGAGPTYVSVHPSGKFLVANYFGGSVAVLPILDGGQLGPPSDVKRPQGKIGPTRATNAPPGSFAISGHDRTHAHMIQADPAPAGRFVVHADLGLDTLFIWTLDDQKGVLNPAPKPTVTLPAGDGPRHFAFHPNGRWFYCIQEEGSNVVLFDFDGAAGTLTARQTITTLPRGFAGSNFCSEILISPDGRFLYAGNRLHDSIAIFAIGRDGTLTNIGEEWTRGSYPRSFSFDPSGRFLYCCNQRGDNVACFRVDAATGKLAFTGHYTAVGNPSTILFVDLGKGK